MSDDIDWMTMDLGSLDPTKIMTEMGLNSSPSESLSSDMQAKQACVSMLLTEVDHGYQNCEFQFRAYFWPHTSALDEQYMITPKNADWAFYVRVAKARKGAAANLFIFQAGRVPIELELPNRLATRLFDDAESFFHDE